MSKYVAFNAGLGPVSPLQFPDFNTSSVQVELSNISFEGRRYAFDDRGSAIRFVEYLIRKFPGQLFYLGVITDMAVATTTQWTKV